MEQESQSQSSSGHISTSGPTLGSSRMSRSPSDVFLIENVTLPSVFAFNSPVFRLH